MMNKTTKTVLAIMALAVIITLVVGTLAPLFDNITY